MQSMQKNKVFIMIKIRLENIKKLLNEEKMNNKDLAEKLNNTKGKLLNQ